jgi:CorA-like Mg2+ transporter protein
VRAWSRSAASSFVTAETDSVKWTKEMRAQLKTMQRDVASLTDHASYLSNKITFVLDAMLGVVNLEQNNIIKLFSVMAVVLMPPTLIASIYGMNFKKRCRSWNGRTATATRWSRCCSRRRCRICFSNGRSGYEPHPVPLARRPVGGAVSGEADPILPCRPGFAKLAGAFSRPDD